MSAEPDPPPALLENFDVSTHAFVEETAAARIWRVTLGDGRSAALKVYVSGDKGNESKAADFLRAANGVGAAHVYAEAPAALLTERLPGPSLGDLSRGGRDADAAHELVAVANRLHASLQCKTSGWPTLDTWFAPLFGIEFATECDGQARKHIARCQALAQYLLASQHDPRPLHGDLHHDNVRRSPRGYCAFDAKGVVGARAYELANAFRHPKGAPNMVRDPARLRYLQQLWSDGFAVEARELMGWAVAKVALSIAWRSGGVLTWDPELDLLDMMVGVLDDS